MRVLIVEDEAAVAESLCRGLREAGFSADYVLNGEEGLRKASSVPAYDVVVLDIGLGPEMDGYAVCRALRARRAASAVLMLTARDELGDRLVGFDAGADDYLAKPFAFEEVLARIRALSRRADPAADGALTLGDLSLDFATRRLLVGDTEVTVTRREFDVVELLLRNQHQVLSREQIHDALWSHDLTPQSSIVEVYIGRIRKRLEAAGSLVNIETIRGHGYRLHEIT